MGNTLWHYFSFTHCPFWSGGTRFDGLQQLHGCHLLSEGAGFVVEHFWHNNRNYYMQTFTNQKCQGDVIRGHPCLVFVHKVRDATSSFFRFRASYSTAIRYCTQRCVVHNYTWYRYHKEGVKRAMPPYILLLSKVGVWCGQLSSTLSWHCTIPVDSRTYACRKWSSTLFLHVIITTKEL